MSVYRPSRHHKTYIYDFRYGGERYHDSTHQTTKQAALLVEAKKKLELRAAAGGLAPAVVETPTFSAWAEVALAYQTKFISRPEILERTLRMVLAFWGAAPRRKIGPAAVARREHAPRPYHNLRLGDPISDPAWLERFEQWMEARKVSGSTRNSYLSACSDLYQCALQPQYKASTGIAINPFAGIRRSPTRTRVVALSADQILRLVDEAGRHIALALCIAALAPKLRVSTILSLEWSTHFDPDLTMMTIADHKTRQASGLDQVVPVSQQLRAILQDVREAQREQDRLDATPDPTRRPTPVPWSDAVIRWRGRRVYSIKTGLRRAVKAIGLRWGLADGVTFHVMRHSVATILANPHLVGALTERLRADVMGHRELRTTQKYTHLNTSVQEGPHEALSATLPGLHAALTQKTKASTSVVKSEGTPHNKTAKTPTKPITALRVLPHRNRAKTG